MNSFWVLRNKLPNASMTAATATAAAIISGASWYLASAEATTSQCESSNGNHQPKLVFLGTGSSTGCPKPLCSMLFQKFPSTDPELLKLQQEHLAHCQTSNKAITGDPKHNKDYRNNPCLLISHYDQAGAVRNVVFDVGKTFRETALRWMPEHNIRSLDAVILTHHHMDAVAGLDDIRGFQRVTGLSHSDPREPRSSKIYSSPVQVPMNVFLSLPCLTQVSSQFPWLFPKPNADLPAVKRHVAALQVNIIDDYVPFTAAGLNVIPLPVLHGDDLISLGFAFSVTNQDGMTKTNIVYLSDISKMIPATLEYILTKLPPTDILIVDTLGHDIHPVHFSLAQAQALSKQIKPKQHTYLIGMSCDSFPSHDEMNQRLANIEGLNMSLAHDGLVVEFKATK